MKSKINNTRFFKGCKERFSDTPNRIAIFIAEYIRTAWMFRYSNQSCFRHLIYRYLPLRSVLCIIEVYNASFKINIMPFKPEYLTFTHTSIKSKYNYWLQSLGALCQQPHDF